MNNIFSKAQTPQELYELMCKHLVYMFVGYTTITTICETGVASCWGAADLQFEELTRMGFKTMILFLATADLERTHTVTVFEDDDYWYSFEWAWSERLGISRPYLILDTLKQELVKSFEKIYGEAAYVVEHHECIGKVGFKTVEYLLSAIKGNIPITQ